MKRYDITGYIFDMLSKRGYHREEFSRYLGVDMETLDLWEQEDAIPVEHILSISNYLNLPVEAVLQAHPFRNPEIPKPWPSSAMHVISKILDGSFAQDIGMDTDNEAEWALYLNSVTVRYFIPLVAQFCKDNSIPVDRLFFPDDSVDSSVLVDSEELELISLFRKLDKRGKALVKAKAYTEADYLSEQENTAKPGELPPEFALITL